MENLVFDVKKVEAEARAEISKEQGEAAKKKIIGKLRQIAQAEAVVANLRLEYEALLRDIGSEA
jgi:hypothetical protein